MKIDVEGAEGRVVAGAQRILETWRPVVATELSVEMLPRVSGIGGEEYLEGFEKLGYRISLLNRATGLARCPGDGRTIMKDWADPFQIEDLLLLPRRFGTDATSAVSDPADPRRPFNRL